MKATLKIEIEFEDWFSDGLTPTTNEHWAAFFDEYFVPDGAVIGFDGADEQKMICMNKTQIECLEVKE